MKLETKKDWWDEFSSIKEDIREWGPIDREVGSFNLNLIYNQALYEYFVENKEKTFWTIVDELETEKNPLLWAVLETIWESAPDKSYIHEWKSWGRFCDLCSEGYLLLEDNII